MAPVQELYILGFMKKQKNDMCDDTKKQKKNDNDNNEMWQIKKQIIIWTKVAEMLIKNKKKVHNGLFLGDV